MIKEDPSLNEEQKQEENTSTAPAITATTPGEDSVRLSAQKNKFTSPALKQRKTQPLKDNAIDSEQNYYGNKKESVA
jgi:hypothetical protein